ncbi:MAG: hypothetical protein ABIZ80_23820, partial [Bryobacteraceae bacterium]
FGGRPSRIETHTAYLTCPRQSRQYEMKNAPKEKEIHMKNSNEFGNARKSVESSDPRVTRSTTPFSA